MLMPPIFNIGMTEEALIQAVTLYTLQWFRGNKTQAAHTLGINVKTIDNRLERYENERKLAEQNDTERKRTNVELLNRMRGTPGQTIAQVPTDIFSPGTGIYVESAPQVPAQQPVPVPQRQEVQKVLPQHNTASGKHPRR